MLKKYLSRFVLLCFTVLGGTYCAQADYFFVIFDNQSGVDAKIVGSRGMYAIMFDPEKRTPSSSMAQWQERDFDEEPFVIPSGNAKGKDARDVKERFPVDVDGFNYRDKKKDNPNFQPDNVELMIDNELYLLNIVLRTDGIHGFRPEVVFTGKDGKQPSFEVSRKTDGKSIYRFTITRKDAS